MKDAHRKELKASYKLTPPAMGVYSIRNMATGKTLLDRSRNLPGAINRHRFELTQGHHRNSALQSDWQSFGEQNFSFEIVDIVKPSADPAFDTNAEIDALLALRLESCPRGAENSYL